MSRDIQVYGSFVDHKDLERAVDDLKNSNFTGERISVLLPDRGATMASDYAEGEGTMATEGAVAGASTGALVGSALGWLAGIGAIAIPGLGPFVAAGPITALLAGAGAGGAVGGLTGALLGLGIPEHETQLYEESARQGATLISIACMSYGERETATSILRKNNARNVSSIGETMRVAEGQALAERIEVERVEDVKKRAYEIWQEEGCPRGREAQNWAQAEREVESTHEHGAHGGLH